MLHTGDELVVPDDLPDSLKELVKRELLPLVKARPDQRAYRWRISPAGFQQSAPDRFRSLIEDLDGYALAAWYRPPRGVRECLYLPDLVTDIGPWLLMAFKAWAAEEPDVYPAEPEWTSNPQWMTAGELDALSRVNEQKADAARLISEAEASVAKAEKALFELQEQADSSERHLITVDGDALVAVVQETLGLLGFNVADVDASLAEGQAKKEDLRVTEGDWTALCEVKGYSKGAKGGDLSKLQGYATLFAAEAGRAPDAMWYVVNQWRETDPSSRPVLLPGGDEYVDTFADQGGLLIDTRDLFLLRKAVAADSISREAVRAWMKSSTGRFEMPPVSQVDPETSNAAENACSC